MPKFKFHKNCDWSNYSLYDYFYLADLEDKSNLSLYSFYYIKYINDPAIVRYYGNNYYDEAGLFISEIKNNFKIQPSNYIKYAKHRRSKDIDDLNNKNLHKLYLRAVDIFEKYSSLF